MGRVGKDGGPDPASHCERGGSLEGLGRIQQLELSTSQGREGLRPGQERKLLLSLTDCFPRMVPLKLHLLWVFLELWHLSFNKWGLILLSLHLGMVLSMLGRNRKQTVTIEELSDGPDQGTEVMTRH